MATDQYKETIAYSLGISKERSKEIDGIMDKILSRNQDKLKSVTIKEIYACPELSEIERLLIVYMWSGTIHSGLPILHIETSVPGFSTNN